MAPNIHEQSLTYIEVVDLKNNLVTLRCKQALPLGSRVSFDLENDGLKYRGKITEIKKGDSEIYCVQIRLHNFSKAHFEQLSEHLSLWNPKKNKEQRL